jgi:hypothetical protein
MEERLIPLMFGIALLFVVFAMPWVIAWYSSSRRPVRPRVPLR